MAEKHERICLFCRHFWMDMGDPGYGEYTPGYGATMRCGKGYWKLDYGDDARDLRPCMLKAQTCPDYEVVEGYENKVK